MRNDRTMGRNASLDDENNMGDRFYASAISVSIASFITAHTTDGA